MKLWLKQLLPMYLLLLWAPLPLAGQAGDAPAQGGRDAAIRDHLRALEDAASVDLDDLVADFERNRFSQAFMQRTTREERRTLLAAVRQAAAQAGAVMVQEQGDLVILRFEGPQTVEVQYSVLADAPFPIDTLNVVDVASDGTEIVLMRDNLAETFQQCAREGFSGVAYVRKDGEVLLQKAYGQANAELGIPMMFNTIFGIGSTPIDFTVAAIYLLAQEGRVSLDDQIAQFFEEVPSDKRSMTIRHLLTGASGLPDFFHTDDDWDPDLAWVDRSTAERRILSLPLLFEPGQGQAHSHAAFVLLAAVVERASGKAYRTFIRQRLLDPAGMTRTGMYGDALALGVADFAVGAGPSFVGLPNIPPNWGPTSWLVMGSGGMCSTAGDLLRFYDFVRTSGVLEPAYAERYRGIGVGVGGSDRGFYVAHFYHGVDNEGIILANVDGRSGVTRRLSRALEQFVTGEAR